MFPLHCTHSVPKRKNSVKVITFTVKNCGRGYEEPRIFCETLPNQCSWRTVAKAVHPPQLPLGLLCDRHWKFNLTISQARKAE